MLQRRARCLLGWPTSISGEKRKARLSKTDDEKQAIKDAAIARKDINKKKRLDPSHKQIITLKDSIEANEELKKLDEQ